MPFVKKIRMEYLDEEPYVATLTLEGVEYFLEAKQFKDFFKESAETLHSVLKKEREEDEEDCHECGVVLPREALYCPECGQAVWWWYHPPETHDNIFGKYFYLP